MSEVPSSSEGGVKWGPVVSAAGEELHNIARTEDGKTVSIIPDDVRVELNGQQALTSETFSVLCHATCDDGTAASVVNLNCDLRFGLGRFTDVSAIVAISCAGQTTTLAFNAGDQSFDGASFSRSFRGQVSVKGMTAIPVCVFVALAVASTSSSQEPQSALFQLDSIDLVIG